MAVNVWGIVSVVVFYIVILVIGILAARKAKSTEKNADSEEVMLAGRSIGLVIGAFTMTATWVGGGYINGTAEGVYSAIERNGKGLVMTQAPIGYSISLIFGGLFFAKRMRAAGYVTMLDPLQERFGQRMGGLLFLPALSGEVFWSAAVLSALGSTLAVIIDMEMWISIVVSACIAMMYTVIGGLYSVAYTDVVQLVCILIGLVISIPFAMSHDAVKPLYETVNDIAGGWLGYISGATWGSYIDSYLLLIFGGIPWQVYFQRVLSSESPRSAQILSFIAAAGCLILAIPPILIGAIGYSTDWNATSYAESGGSLPPEGRLVLPLVLQYLTPTAVSFVGLGAVSAAVMSSADSSMLSSSSMFARNIYKVVFRQQASEREIVWVMRISTVVFGALSTIMAIFIQSIYGLFHLCGDFVYVMLFPQLTAALYIDKANTYGSLAGYITSLTLRLLGGEPLLSLPPAIKYLWFNEVTGVQNFPMKTFSMLVGFLVLILVSLLMEWLFKSERLPIKYDLFNCFADREVIESENKLNGSALDSHDSISEMTDDTSFKQTKL